MTQRGMADDLMREMLQAMDARDARLAARLGFTGNYLSASHVVGAGGSLLTHGATGHIAGNPGDILYAGASGQWNRRAGPTTVAEVKWLQISGGASANLASGPQWATLPSAAAGAPHTHDNSGTASGGPLLNDLHTGYSEYRLISTPTTTTGLQLYGKTGTSGLYYQTPGGQEVGPLASGGGGGAGSGITGDDFWGARGDLAMGTTDNAATRIPIGTAYQYLHPTTTDDTVGATWDYRAKSAHLIGDIAVTTGAGDIVTRWQDQSGWGSDLVNPSTDAPVWIDTGSGINGHRVLRFDGANDRLTYFRGVANEPFPPSTIMTVIRRLSTADGGIIAYTAGDADGTPSLAILSGSTDVKFYFFGGYNASFTVATGAATLLTWVWDGHTANTYRNSTVMSTTTGVIVGNNYRLMFGGNLTGYANFEVAEFIHVRKALKDTQRTDIETALKTKYGI